MTFVAGSDLGTARADVVTSSPEAAPPATNPPNGGEAAPTSRVTEIHVVGSVEQFDSLRQVIGSHRVGRASVRWRRLEQFVPETLLASSRNDGLDVRCWIDLTRSDRATLYFADRSSERFLVREVPLSRRMTELEKEALAQVVETSIMALLEDSTLGLSRANVQALLLGRATPPAAPPQAAPPEPPPAHAHWRPLLVANYRVQSFSPQIGQVHGPGAAFGVARYGRDTRLDLTLRINYQIPESYRNQDGGVRLSSFGWHAGVGLALPFFGRNASAPDELAYVGTFVSAGVSVLSVTPEQATGSRAVEMATSRSILVPTMSAGCRLTQPVSSWGFSVGIMAEFDLQRVSYDVRRNGELVTVLRAHTVRPTLIAELGWP